MTDMDGIVTRTASATTDEAFEVAFYEVKDVTGRRTEPIETAVNMVSCHGDSERATSPELRTVDSAGRAATRDQPYFDWGSVCPTHPGYRDELLALIERCSEAAPAVRLDDVGFARDEYCRCERCQSAFEAASTDDFHTWRCSVVTAFLEAASERIAGRTYLTVYPDPYPGHLRRRSGIDLASVEPLVDEVVVPLYDLAYETTYWLEALASGFADTLSSASLGIEVYGIDIESAKLVHAVEVAEAIGDHVYVAYDTAAARTVATAIAES